MSNHTGGIVFFFFWAALCFITNLMRINMTTINRKTGLNDKPYNLIITSMERIYPALQ